MVAAKAEVSISADQVIAAEQQIIDQSKRIDFYITEYNVEILANKMQAGEYVVPSYQREFTWEEERKSKFIESLIMGLPIPFIFFWEMPDGRLEVVDGSQRLRTIQEFILGDFQLGKLEQLEYLSGFRFSDLPESRQRKIRNRSIRGIVLNEHADDAARLDMFERINTGSKIANKAEIRRGALAGPFLSLVIDLAKDERLIRLAPMSDKRKNERGYEELVTRFFAYGDGLDGYRDKPADFIFNYSRKMNEKLTGNPRLEPAYRQRFHDVMEFIERVFPNGFRKGPAGRATPHARFEAIAIGSYLALMDRPELARADQEALNVASWVDGSEFTDVTGSDGANARARLEGRLGFVRDRLVSAL
ncbi:hypothetical protein Aph02nite_49970 [Actinoplanes philippinensis]|uniref:GmrSD restriction endonucleases N-terminal domain-containing protein n=1 Tax=Actinoplanes philippinensis TaxID=35752 RepID=A0A1I2IQU4_9ACTN|nr:DUF262 domain-containing protein [Actinoplanes philippinensis]GIE79047.1 hypothetical protein Aph02nite_49970 [Actinoplanes philippinensis]SFF44649.1 Protein of unknown function DUF262 [Actinoplanes philippinensis]